MAFQTGIVNSAADLAAAIRNFAVANGWTLTGNVVSKLGAYIEITSPSTSEVRFRGAKDGNFAGADLCQFSPRIFFTSWPTNMTYQMFGFEEPDTIWCTIQPSQTTFNHCGFGSIAKYGDWEGGAWFHAQYNQLTGDGACCSSIDGAASTSGYGAPAECGLFWSQNNVNSWSGAFTPNAASNLLCDLRGNAWEPPNNVVAVGVHCPTVIGPTHKNNPNVFNGQTLLTPFQLFLLNTDGNYMAIGHVEHVRFVKLTNYNAGDIIELGADKWKLFPWHKKDSDLPDGKFPTYSNPTYSTGLLGVAVRYDGT